MQSLLKSNFLLVLFLCAGMFLGGNVYASTTFFVDGGYDWEGKNQRNATQFLEGDRARWFLADDYFRLLSVQAQNELLLEVGDLAREFDEVIYPRIRAVFGSEHTPGIDEDSKITVLLTRMLDEAGGYFREEDSVLGIRDASSNEREMVYLNARHMKERNRMRAFLAHEFQHLITFHQKTVQKGIQEEVWLNEFRSEIASTLLGYDEAALYAGSNLEARVRAFLDDPTDAILDWENQGKDYGSINLFAQYILGRYGRSVIASMIQNDKVGIASFNEALGAFGFRENFSDVFTNWTVTNLVNDCSVEPRDAYCYAHPSLGYDTVHIRFGATDDVGRSVDSEYTTKDWKGAWFLFERAFADERPEDDVFEFKFSAPATSNFRVPYVVYKEDAAGILEVKEAVVGEGVGEFYLEDFGFRVPKVVIIPTNQSHATGTSGADAPHTTYSFTASLINEVPARVPGLDTGKETGIIGGGKTLPLLPAFPDGTLVRLANDYKVYVIQGRYKRWIQSPEIFSFYGHLNLENVQIVEPEVLALHKDSWLVRAQGNERVYEINGDGSRHWLDMTPEDFVATGRLWDMVYVVNDRELRWYQEGPSVK